MSNSIWIVLVLLFVVRYSWKYYKHYKKVGHIPGHRQILPSTHLVFYRLFKKPLRTLFPFLAPYLLDRYEFLVKVIGKWFRDNESARVMSIVSLDEAVIVIRDPEVIKDVLMNKRQIIDKPHLYRLFEVFGTNILSAREKSWRKHRTLANPAFSESNLRLVIESNNILSNKLIKKWEEMITYNPNIPINMSKFMTELTFGVISHAGFGIQDNHVFESTNDGDSQMNLRVALELIFKSLYVRYTFPLLLNLPTKHFKRTMEAYEYFETTVQNLVMERKLAKKNGLISNHTDLLSLLAQNEEDGTSLSTMEVLSNSFVFFIAGHDTTSGTLQFALKLLAAYPDVQQKVYEEAMNILGESREPSYEDFNELNYCKNVIKETLRLYPIVQYIAKETLEDTEIAGYPVKKGTLLRISTHALHRHAKYWQNPDNFIPERFDQEDSKKIPNTNYTWMPFSVGPRNCIGSKFAMVESVTTLSVLCRKFRYELPPGVKKEFNGDLVVTLKSKPDCELVVKRRSPI